MKPFQKNQPLSEYSTFGIGGKARLFTSVDSIEELQKVLKYCHEYQVPFLVIGKGSNFLFDDQGFDGLVIQNKISFCKFREDGVEVGAWYSFSLLGSQTARKGFSGLEFASGIPGSVGGAVFMNAGACGSEVCNVIEEVVAIDPEGNLHHLKKGDLQFSYRWSCFHENRWVVAAASFRLTRSRDAREKQLSILEKRMKSQPYSEKSCGCVFRNPKEESAGALIERCGLKGAKRGGAEVSTLHANFIINTGGASAEDVRSLAEYVKQQVKEQKGIELEMELRSVVSS